MEEKPFYNLEKINRPKITLGFPIIGLFAVVLLLLIASVYFFSPYFKAKIPSPSKPTATNSATINPVVSGKEGLWGTIKSVNAVATNSAQIKIVADSNKEYQATLSPNNKIEQLSLGIGDSVPKIVSDQVDLKKMSPGDRVHVITLVDVSKDSSIASKDIAIFDWIKIQVPPPTAK